MPEFWQQLIIQIAVSFVSGLLGGGLISTYLDWRRFRQEQVEIKKEEQRVAVDSIRSVISAYMWKARDEMSDKQQLYVFKHNLQGSVSEYVVVAEFVIRNLTDDEIIITGIEVEEPGLRPFEPVFTETDDAHEARYTPDGTPYVTATGTDLQFHDMQALYDWRTKKKTNIEYVTLKPKETLPVAYVAVRRFFALRKLDTAPKTISVTVHSTEEHSVVKVLELTSEALFRRPDRVDDYRVPRFSIELQEEEIPF